MTRHPRRRGDVSDMLTANCGVSTGGHVRGRWKIKKQLHDSSLRVPRITHTHTHTHHGQATVTNDKEQTGCRVRITGDWTHRPPDWTSWPSLGLRWERGGRREREQVSQTVRTGVDGRWWAEHVGRCQGSNARGSPRARARSIWVPDERRCFWFFSRDPYIGSIRWLCRCPRDRLPRRPPSLGPSRGSAHPAGTGPQTASGTSTSDGARGGEPALRSCHQVVHEGCMLCMSAGDAGILACSRRMHGGRRGGTDDLTG